MPGLRSEGGFTMDVMFNNVSKRRGDDTVLQGVSFVAPAGQITGVIGPNGAGKSTAFRIALGLVAPDSGTVTFGRNSIACVDRRNIGVLLEPSAHPGMQVESQLAIRAKRVGLPKSSVTQVLRLLKITAIRHRRIGKLSLGQRQRVALATALIGQPRLLILDEPANGLDPDGMLWLNNYLRARANAGATVLISSHSLAELDRVVDSVVVLDRTVRWAGDITAMRTSGFGNIGSLFMSVTGDGPGELA